MDDGARWRRVGTTTWMLSGSTEAGLTPDDYPVEFNAVMGWDTPAQRVVAVEVGGTAVSTGIYTRNESQYQITVEAGPLAGTSSARASICTTSSSA